MDNSLNSVLEESKSVLVLLPKEPSLDQVAAGLSLYLALQDNKNISISSPSPMLVEYNRLVGVNKVQEETGNKNLVIKLNNYRPEDIDRVSYDIENGEIYLTIAPVNSAQAPKREQVEIKYSGVSADTIILIGGSSMDSFPDLQKKEFANLRLVHIGINALDQAKQNIISLASPASSVSELVARYIKTNNLNLNEDIATNLIAGIEEGSNNFNTENVTAETFSAMANLMQVGGRRLPAPQMPSRENYPPGSIPGENIEEEKPPKDWSGPKIYKGTTVS